MGIDPICGMTVDEASALCAERDGQTFYFCSDHCRQKFLSTPATAKHEEKPQRQSHLHLPDAPGSRSRIIPAIAPSAAWRWNRRR